MLLTSIGTIRTSFQQIADLPVKPSGAGRSPKYIPRERTRTCPSSTRP
ncbi:hypothetical protein [Trichloromonas sp.]